MREITLGAKREIPVLKVNIGDKAYAIPLAGALTPKKILALNTEEKTINWFRQYIPDEVADTLTINDWNELITAWGEASNENSGMTPGESSASRTS